MQHSALLLVLLGVILTGCISNPASSLPDQRIAVVTDPQTGKVVAVPKACPTWVHRTSDGLENDAMPSYGCAQNYNLAKTIVNPNDLVRGRAPSMADAAPGVLSIERYREDKKKILLNPKDTESTTN